MIKAAAGKKISIKPKAKVKPQRASGAVSKSLDLKVYGPEPIDVSVKGYGAALNWYNYMFEHDQAREWLLEYMKKSEFQRDHIAAIRRCPKYKMITTIGWQARIMMNGNELTEKSKVFFKTHVDELIALGITIKEVMPETDQPVVNIRQRTEVKIQQLLTECEQAVDNDSYLNVYDWLQGKEANPQAATVICDYYSKWIKDFEYEDEFESRSEKKIRLERLKYWTQFVYDCERYVGNKKIAKVRKPSVKKVKSAVDLVKSLKYQKEFPPLKIVSANPAEIIGAAQVWVYNTKYRKLTRYDAIGPGGIQVKGASLASFDVEKSLTKSLRKPEETIQSLLGAGKIALRKIMDDLKTNESKPTGRINTDTILLRIIR